MTTAVECGGVLLALAPLALVTIGLGWHLERRHEFNSKVRHAVTVAALVAATVALLLMSSSSYLSAVGRFWSSLSIGDFARVVGSLPPLAAVGLPLGLGLGFVSRRLFEWQRRRHPIDGSLHREARRTRMRAYRALAAETPEGLPFVADGQVVLGAWIDGDNPPLGRVGDLATLPGSAHHSIFLGATGSGKSEAILRLASASLALGHQVIVIDAKEDPEISHRLAGIARTIGVASSRIRLWPVSGPIDFFQGDAQGILDRCEALVEWSEPWYRVIAKTSLRLAIEQPQGLPTSLGELVSRLDSAAIKATWAGTDRAEVAATLTPELVRGCRLRYFEVQSSLESVGAVPSPDGGRGWSWSSCDLAWLCLPTSSKPGVAASLGRIALLDLIHYFRSPERRVSDRPVLLIIEELGALISEEETAKSVLELLERCRSAGVRVVLSGQSPQSLGSPETQDRLLRTGAAVVCMRMPAPEPVLELLGTRRVLEASLGMSSEGEYLDAGSVREQQEYALSPNAVRQFPVGRAALIHEGKFSLIQIARV